jgi:hypothetical protein
MRIVLAIEPIQLFFFGSGEGGTTSAIGLPNLVMQTVLRTRCRTAIYCMS